MPRFLHPLRPNLLLSKLLLPLCLLLLALPARAQLVQANTTSPAPTTATQVDRVLAIVDNDIILQSQVENQYRYMLSQNQKDDGTMRCRILEQLLSERLLLAKAKLDSLEVGDDQVESDLNRRVGYMVQQFGSAEELAKRYRKSVPEIKAELRSEVKDKLLIERQRDEILDKVVATPREVQDFFNKIPKDSLPFLPAEVEISHIVVAPKPTAAAKAEAKKKLEDIRAQILGGEIKFEEAAAYYGMDGTKSQGGDLGEFGRGQMDPAFEETVYSLQPAEVSPVFESSFGFHIARLDARSGDRVTARHILILPKITADDEKKAQEKLRQIRDLIQKDSLSFAQAAAKYSADKRSADNGGMIQAQSGYRIPIDQLDADLYFKIDRLKEGEISDPMPMEGQGPTRSYHMVLLRKRYAPHVANLKDDYTKFQQATINSKNAIELERWFQRARQQVYIEIKANECSQALAHWQ